MGFVSAIYIGPRGDQNQPVLADFHHAEAAPGWAFVRFGTDLSAVQQGFVPVAYLCLPDVQVVFI